ncbi:hypothetical protein VXN63_02325 [Marinilactibacillus sp. XAAS-LB27]|uniref:hypothetical protein n=1 Tax=Marinilactibacillus sp. XAAS-LB27 TaxID=3114538 RepID=UPI002E17A01B|nr:hypothetical protein [Marinilactibacillus sp. XAAS-LB27]
MKNVLVTAIALTAIGVAIRAIKNKKCLLCNSKAILKINDGVYICEDCAQIQGELSGF